MLRSHRLDGAIDDSHAGHPSAHGASSGARRVVCMSQTLVVRDCPVCRGQGTVVLGTYGVCIACFAEFGNQNETIRRGGEEAPSLPTWC